MDVIKKYEPLFGEWHVERFIGAGSFGRVYKIYREELGRRFYSALKYISIPSEESEVKQLRADGMDNASISTYYGSLAKNVSSEIDLMNRLKGNTNIISFEDSRIMPKPGGIGYDIFIRMELLESLTNRIAEKPLPVDEIVKLGRDICNALILCAKNSIIHRDVKPDNIFISPNGDYKLGDFGIARQLEKTATFMSKKGTYNYMAPEVYKGERYGAGCDIYSLGLVMYRLLNNGRLPFLPPAPRPMTPDDKEDAIIRRMKGEPLPAPCNADPALSRIVLKACAYDPHVRYQSAAEMRRDIENLPSAKNDISAEAPVRRSNVIISETGKWSANSEETVSAQGTGYTGVPTDPGRTKGTATAAWDRVFCPYCGKPHRSDSRFCMFCGKPVYAPEKAEKKTAQTTPVEPKKKDRKFIGIILALLLLTAIAVTVTVIVLISGRCEKDSYEDREADTVASVPVTSTKPSVTKANPVTPTPVTVTKPPVTEPVSQITDTETPTPTPTTPTPTPTPPTPTPTTPTPTPTPPPTLPPTPTPTPVPDPFMFGGKTILPGQTEVKIRGKRDDYILITSEEMDQLIRNCPNLTELSLEYCYMADYRKIGKLTSLETLTILRTTISQKDRGNPLTNIDWIGSLTNLRTLNLSYNYAIDDISGLAGLTNLEEVRLAWNEIKDDDLKWLKDLKKLKRLVLHNNPLYDLSYMPTINSLEALHVGGNKEMKYGQNLTVQPNLKELNISYCPIKDFKWLSKFTKLKTLVLSKIERGNISVDYEVYKGLAECKSLRTIMIEDNDKTIEQKLKRLIEEYNLEIEIKLISTD